MIGLLDDLRAGMTTTRWVLALLLLGAALGFGAGELAHHFQRQAALEQVEELQASANLEAELRVVLEAERDARALELAAELVELRKDSVETARVLEDAEQVIRVATVRAGEFADSALAHADSATTIFLEAHLAEDLVRDVANERRVGVLADENVRLWSDVRRLEDLVADGLEIEERSRSERELLEAIISSQAQALDPPFSIRLFGGAKVAVPALLTGYGLATLLGSGPG